MDSSIMPLDRKNLYQFCDDLPEPFIAQPVLLATREQGFTLTLEYDCKRVMLTENGKPYKFKSINAVMFELDGAPHVNTDRLLIETANYWMQ